MIDHKDFVLAVLICLSFLISALLAFAIGWWAFLIGVGLLVASAAATEAL